jgi:hypothetical protein
VADVVPSLKKVPVGNVIESVLENPVYVGVGLVLMKNGFVIPVIVSVVPPETEAFVKERPAWPSTVPLVGSVIANGMVRLLKFTLTDPLVMPWSIGVRSVIEVVDVKIADVNGTTPYSTLPTKLESVPVDARAEYDVNTIVLPVVPD